MYALDCLLCSDLITDIIDNKSVVFLAGSARSRTLMSAIYLYI